MHDCARTIERSVCVRGNDVRANDAESRDPLSKTARSSPVFTQRYPSSELNHTIAASREDSRRSSGLCPKVTNRDRHGEKPAAATTARRALRNVRVHCWRDHQLAPPALPSPPPMMLRLQSRTRGCQLECRLRAQGNAAQWGGDGRTRVEEAVALRTSRGRGERLHMRLCCPCSTA